MKEIGNVGKNGRTPSKHLPKIPIDWEKVKKLCQIQCTIGEICGFLEIANDTLSRACKQNYGCTPAETFAGWYEGGKCSLRRKQWVLADTSAAMGIFLGKQVLKQTDDYHVNHKGEMEFQVVHYGDNEPKKWTSKDAGDTEK